MLADDLRCSELFPTNVRVLTSLQTKRHGSCSSSDMEVDESVLMCPSDMGSRRISSTVTKGTTLLT
jgi:hypothetical protein